MIRWWLRFGLFVSSYFAAFLIIFILYLRRNPVLAWAALAFGLFGCLALLVVLWYLKSLIPQPLKVESCLRQDTEAMTYVVSYVVPFLSGITEGAEPALAFGVFFVVIGILYVNSNMIHINPMLNLMGYRIYRLEVQGRPPASLVTRQRVRPGATVTAVEVDEEIFVA
jgi:hypothetical protein